MTLSGRQDIFILTLPLLIRVDIDNAVFFLFLVKIVPLCVLFAA